MGLFPRPRTTACKTTSAGLNIARLSTIVFPFWNLIREDVYEDVVILGNDDGVCYVETSDNIPKTIEDCTLNVGDKITIKFGDGLAWATLVNP